MSTKLSNGTLFQLGTYVGNPDGNTPANEANFEQNYNAFVTSMGGARPATMDAFIDDTSPSNWAGSASWDAWSWNQSGPNYVSASTGIIPVVGVPMATNATGWSNVDTFYQQIIAGTYDSDYAGIVDAWANQGFKTMDLRIGWEFNGSFMSWSPLNSTSPTANQDFVKAWQHIANLVHAEGTKDGVKVNTVWTPAQINTTPVSTASLYPGNGYVDIIGTDAYSPVYPLDLYDWHKNNGTYDTSLSQWMADPVNRAHFWTYPNATAANPTGTGYGWSVLQAEQFAAANGKPLAIDESGAGGDGSTTGPVDDPAFPAWLASTLAQSAAPIAYVNVWDTNVSDGNWNFSNGSKPLENTAYGQYFGTGATAPPTSTTAGPPPAGNPTGTTIGSGADTLIVNLSEDAYAGNAIANVSIDGTYLGSVTVTALHGSGQTEAFTFLGNWGSGAHSVQVTFTNDAYGGSASTDRNLYIDTLIYDGQTLSPHTEQASNGSQAFGFASTAAPPAVPTPPVVGSGSDTLTLNLSEDAYLGDAQFIVSIDGTQIGGTYTAVALHSAGQDETFTFKGNWGSGAHHVAVTFLNDAWGGSASADRNLYIDTLSYDGQTLSPHVEQGTNGTQSFAFAATSTSSPASGAAAVPTPAPIGSGPDTLILNLSEDAYLGDALFTVAVDGTQVGGTYSVVASHGAGQDEAFTLNGNWGAGTHTVTVSFLNDAWGGSAALDRNLYIDTLSYDGATISPKVEQATTGSQTFTVGTPVAGAASPPSLSVTDNAGRTVSLPVVKSGGSASDFSAQTGLTGNVYEWTDQNGAIGITPSSFGLVPNVTLTDTTGGSYDLANFTENTVNLGGASSTAASASSLVVRSASGGTITLGSGDYNVTVNALANTFGASNTFNVTLGAGDDTFSLTGDSGTTQAVLHAGSGTQNMRFVNTGAVQVFAGSGTDTITGGNQGNTVTAGTGSADVTGGTGADSFIWHAGDGLMTVETFNAGKGDTLTFDASLQSSLHQTAVSGGVLLSVGTDTTHGILVKGASSVASSAIHWA